MYQKEPAVLNLDGQRRGNMLYPRLVVAPDYINRGNFLQPVDDFRFIDVAAVDNGVTAVNGGQYLRAEQPVGVRQYRNF